MPALRPTIEQRDQALAELARAADAMTAAALSDPALNEALQPFRGRPPLPLRCTRPRCRRTMAWLALGVNDARVVFAINGPRKGHVKKVNSEGRPAQLMRQPPAPFNYWSLGPSGGIDSAEPANPPTREDQLRWRFTCPKCGAEYVLKNGSMIKLLVAADTRGEREITP